MTVNDRIKLVVKWLIGKQLGNTQEDIGKLLGYTNKSSFSQVINGKVALPVDFIERLSALEPNINKVWIENGKGKMVDENKVDRQIRFLTLFDQLKNANKITSEDDFCCNLGFSNSLFNKVLDGNVTINSEDFINTTDEYKKYVQWILTGENSPFISNDFQIPGLKFAHPILKSNDGRYLIPESMWNDYMKYIEGKHECTRCIDKDKIIMSLEKQIELLEKQIEGK